MIREVALRARYPIFTYELGKALWIALTEQWAWTTPDAPVQKPVVHFCPALRTVLDCANGYQKEDQEEVDEFEEKRDQEGAGTEALTKAKNFEKISEERSRSKESRSEEAGVGEND